MNTAFCDVKSKKMICKRFKGDLFFHDFIQSLYLLKQCNIERENPTIIIDLKCSNLKLNFSELNKLILLLKIELSIFQSLKLILLTTTPIQTAYSYIVKQKLEKPTIQVKICSYYQTAKEIFKE